ncbi:MAG: four helix bundle protein [Candidatus Amesbacteria bacterium]|nr:four helix bundle protein [Candidatus Amesbacteria bacterium]
MANYDLEQRTTDFSLKLISFLKKCPQNNILIPLINQGLRSGTSIGANYHEANGASSKKDFQNKIFICKKEAKETMYWLELIGKSLDDDKLKEECRNLWSEAKELTLIFSKISSSSK